MDLLMTLESSGFSTWIRESNSIWGYPLILTMHTVGLAVLVGANTVLDLRLLGFGARLPLAELSRSFRIMWIGFWINAVSGAVLFAADATTRGTSRLFIGKLILVMFGVLVILGIRNQVFETTTDGPRINVTAKVLAATSLAVWVAAITAGRLMAYVYAS
jgi:hypothetical protein